MNVFNNVKCRLDANGEIWIDLKFKDISLIQQAALMGGQITIYRVNELCFMTFLFRSNKVNIQTFGCELTKDQYESQLVAWEDKNYISFAEGTELTLIDNSYFLKP